MAGRIARRDLLRALAIAGVAPTLWLPGRASAKAVAVEVGLRGTTADELGVTVELGLANGPFPCEGTPYRDNSCFVFVPRHFRVSKEQRIDTMVHFHGHSNTAKHVLERHQLREQFHASRQNAILVVPQGPVEAKDSRGGKLEREGGLLAFLGEIRKALQTPEVSKALGGAAIPAAARIGATVISAHSGGYRVAAACVAQGGWNVNEVYLFDALYGGRDQFREWVAARRDHNAARDRHKLVAWYTKGAVEANCKKLRAELEAEGITSRLELDDEKLERSKMVRARVAFVHTKVGHSNVVHERDALRECLSWSCFTRAP